MKETMLAFVFDGSNGFSLQSVQAPQLSPDNVICRVVSCAICGTDLRSYTKGNNKITPPRIMGHEIYAEITHVGSQFNSSSYPIFEGQKIIIAPAIGCGQCASCKRGYTNMCESLSTIGFQFDGGFAEFMEIPRQALEMGNVIPVPNQLSGEEVILCEPVACVLNGQEFLNVKQEDSVTIFGAGFIGCMHAELARLKQVKKIIMVEFSGFRADQAKKLIPEIILVNPDKEDVVSSIKNHTGSIGSDVLITACSIGQTHLQALEAAAPRGRISLFGGLPEPATGFLNSNLIHYKELGVFGVHASTVKQNREILHLVETRQLNMKKYISRIYPLKEIEEAFKALQKKPLLKVIIKP